MATVLTCYYRPKPGGLCKRLFRTINALLSSGHSVHYLSVVRFPITHPNCHFHHFPWPVSQTETPLFWCVFHAVAPLILLAIGYRYKVSRLFAFGYTYSFLMQPLRLLKGVPVSLFLRADSIRNHEHKHVSKPVINLEKLMEGLGLHGCKLYGVSKALTKATTSRHSLFQPILSETLTNDITKKPIQTASYQPPKLPLKLACVGILENRKNQKMLIDAMQHLMPEQAQLLIFGTGPDEDRLKHKVNQAGLMDRVFFKGWVTADEIWPAIDLLLTPSLHEGCPNAVLEAMENNIPVLASRIPEHEEILPASHLIPIDPSSWTKAVQRILADPVLHLNQLLADQHPFAMSLYFDWDSKIQKRILQ